MIRIMHDFNDINVGTEILHGWSDINDGNAQSYTGPKKAWRSMHIYSYGCIRGQKGSEHIWIKKTWQ